jgi:Zn-dependent M28 family amino/carboxypeptidase
MLAEKCWIGLLLAACATQPVEPPSAPQPAKEPVRESETRSIEVAIDPARLIRDVASFAKPRPPKSAEHRRLQKTLGERLVELGFEIERHDYGSGTNVIGRRRGSASSRDSVVVSAHYDHIPRCSGADDNASGLAAALEIARVLAPASFERTLEIAFWDEEEVGLIGSRAYASRARDRQERIRVAFSLDAIGYASSEPGSQRVPPGFAAALPGPARELEARDHRGDFIAVLANTDASAAVGTFARHARASGLPFLSLELTLLQALAFPDVFRSDHASFWQNGYAAILLSDTGDFRNPGYHCLAGRDSPSTLDHAFLERVTRATALTVADLLGEPSSTRP